MVKCVSSRAVRGPRNPSNTAFHWTQVPGDSGGESQLDQGSPEKTCGSAWRIRKLGGGATFAEPDIFWPRVPNVD